MPGAGEIVSDGRKLAGSAQVRRGGAALQHGTVRLRIDAGNVAPLLRDREGRPPAAGTPPAALDALLGRPVTFTEAAQAVAAGFADRFGVALAGSSLAAAELDRAARLEADRYASGEPSPIPPVSP
jgi:lipoyl(octanoyl) transferase